MQLQFDYPQAPDASTEALAELYGCILREKSTSQIAVEVPVIATLLGSVAVLNNRCTSCARREALRLQWSEVSALVAAFLLILVLCMCLKTAEDARVDVLLSSLVVSQFHQEKRCSMTSLETMQEEELVEIVAGRSERSQ